MAVETDRERFAFGSNWRNFLRLLDEERIGEAERSLRAMTGMEDLSGRRFLDIGSGSGLFSLAARRLGATVQSFDYDRESVACTEELKHRFFPDDGEWKIEQGSVRDGEYLESLGHFDIVYSWGVLHHTGAMWEAIENAAGRVKPGGLLCLSIYNDQGGASRRWRSVKRFYNRSPKPVRWLLVLGVGGLIELRGALIRLLRFQNPLPFRAWREKKQQRGMSVWYDLVDWVGGYPFEVARPEDVFDFCRERGFSLLRMTTQIRGSGCNEYVFVNSPTPEPAGSGEPG